MLCTSAVHLRMEIIVKCFPGQPCAFNTNMGNTSKILERQRLEAQIDEAEQTLELIDRKCDELLDKGARSLTERVGDIYDELLQGGLSPEHEKELIRERNELYNKPLYVELRSYTEPSAQAYEKINKAKDALKQLLGEEAPPLAPPAALAPLPSGNAESKFVLLFVALISSLVAHFALRMIEITSSFTEICILRCRQYPE